MCDGPSFSSVVYAQVPWSPLLSSERHSLHSSSPVEVDWQVSWLRRLYRASSIWCHLYIQWWGTGIAGQFILQEFYHAVPSFSGIVNVPNRFCSILFRHRYLCCGRSRSTFRENSLAVGRDSKVLLRILKSGLNKFLITLLTNFQAFK